VNRILSLLVIAAVSALGMGTAAAADLPVKAPIRSAAPVVPTWTGCYVGANGGYGWAQKHWFDFGPYTDEGSGTAKGGVVGAQLGCDYQSGPFVFGIQGMWDWADMDESHPYALNTGYTDHSKISYFATLTGRLGYAVMPASLIYVKGGAAWVRDKFTETCAASVDVTCPGEIRVTRTGWTIGGVWEYRFAPNWALFAEYNYMDFGKKTHSLVYTDGSLYDYDIKQNLQTVLVGINYRFGAPFVGGY